MKIISSKAFDRDARRHLKRKPDDALDIRETIERLSVDPFDSRLKTYKLHGEYKNSWSCSAGYDLRIIFEFTVSDGEQSILLQTLGSHDDVY